MVNAGGHGTNEAIEEYVRALKEKWNIETIIQVPCSPYTHILDLGVWCLLQAKVEKRHFGQRCKVNALTRSVEDTWNHAHLNDMITKVFDRLRNVLVLIVEVKGKNDLVETKRGKNFYKLDLPIDLTESDSDTPMMVDEFRNEDELLSAADIYDEEEI